MKMTKVETPRAGDLGLTQITGPVGLLIKIGEKLNGDRFSQYQHAFIVLDDARLIEAEPGGAQVNTLSEYAGRDTLYLRPAGLTPAQGDVVATAARQYLGVPYSFLEYLALAAHRFRLPVPWLKTYIESTGHMICSQLADQTYRDAGIQLFRDGRWPGYVTPADLAELSD